MLIIIAAIIAAIPPTLAVWLAARKSKQRQGDIHILVNGRLEEALTKIRHLEARLGEEHVD